MKLAFVLFACAVSAIAQPPATRAMFNRYCVGCHSEQTRAGGVSLQNAFSPTVSERAVRQLSHRHRALLNAPETLTQPNAVLEQRAMKPRGINLAGAREERLFVNVISDGADHALHRRAPRASPSEGELFEDGPLRHAARRSNPGASATSEGRAPITVPRLCSCLFQK